MAALIETSWRDTGIDKQRHRFSTNLMRSRVLKALADYPSDVAQGVAQTEQALSASR
jgi:hypothetical protein